MTALLSAFTGGLSTPDAFTVTYRVKRMFFDRAAVINAMHRKTLAVLRHAGGMTRRIARNSMRRRKGSSPAGQPPHAHMRDDVASLKNILFAYDGDFSVVVGPVALNQLHRTEEGYLEPGQVPHVQEFGGTIGHLEKFVPFSPQSAIRAFGFERGKEYLKKYQWLSEPAARRIYGESFQHRVDRTLGGIWVPISRRRLDRFRVRARSAKYPPRPYMQPALEKTADKFPELYTRTLE